ncbi:MAG: YdeI/OmpD-associated family protein [Pseudomonadota bacterium]
MSFFDHGFEGPICWHDVGSDKYRYSVVYLPADMVDALPFKEHPRLRVEGEIAEMPFNGAWIPAKGIWYLMVPKAIMAGAGLSVGDTVEVRFSVADQNHVDMPDELAALLKQDKEFAKRWDALTPGKQRGYAYLVSSAKQSATRVNRAQKAADLLCQGLGPNGRPL